MRQVLRSLVVVFTTVLLAITLGAQERDRSKIPEKYKWSLADIYPSDASWRAAKEAFAAEIPALGKFKGNLTASPAALADALDTLSSKQKELVRLFSYASLLADQDTRDSQHQGMRQEMTQVAAAFSAAVAFVDPEILKAGKATIDRFMAAEPRLNPIDRSSTTRFGARRTRFPTARRGFSPTQVRWPAARRASTTSSRTPTFPIPPSRYPTGGPSSSIRRLLPICEACRTGPTERR